jgi:hypothetical protein
MAPTKTCPANIGQLTVNEKHNARRYFLSRHFDRDRLRLSSPSRFDFFFVEEPTIEEPTIEARTVEARTVKD